MIGLLTFHWADDYGAMLQAYALKRRLEELSGAEVEIIPYAPHRLEGRYRWFAPCYRVWGGVARFRLVRSVVSWLRHPVPNRAFLDRRRAMARFRNTFLTAKRPLRHVKDLSLNKYTCIFVGSDQMWNPEITLGLDDVYIGNIPHRDGCRLIAYGASLGGKDLPEEYREKFSTCVGAAFAQISLRERSAVPFVEEALRRRVTDVLDPALLLERREWERISVLPKEEGYVLVHQTEPNELLMEYARRAARKLGKPVISVSYYRRDRTPSWVERRTATGPAEFIGYVQNAGCVVTNSFHGVVFSVLFEKQFAAFPHSTTGARMEDLLDKLGLSSRLVTGKSGVWDEMMWETVHWTNVAERLKAEQERSEVLILEEIERSGS